MYTPGPLTGSAATRYLKVWVPAGGTLAVTVNHIGHPRYRFTKWHVQNGGAVKFRPALVGNGMAGSVASLQAYQIEKFSTDPGDPVTKVSGPLSWQNTSGAPVVMYIEFEDVRVFYGTTAEWDVDVSVSNATFEDPGCTDKRFKRGGEVESAADVEDPVNTYTGSFWESRVDLPATASVFGLDWERHYDSGGVAGNPAWGFTFSERVDDVGSGVVELTERSSRVVRFDPDGSGGFERPLEFDGRMSVDGSGWRLDFPDGSHKKFDSTGAMTEHGSWDGQTVTATWTSGRLSALSSSVGPSLALSYTGTQLDSVIASDGRSVSYGYDTNGFLSTATLPGSVVWTYVNDAAGQVEEVHDPTGVVVVDNTYDIIGRVESQNTAPGATTTFGYQGDDVFVTDVGSGEVTTFTYDDDGRVVSVEDSNQETVLRQYDSFDYLSSTTTRGWWCDDDLAELRWVDRTVRPARRGSGHSNS